MKMAIKVPFLAVVAALVLTPQALQADTSQGYLSDIKSPAGLKNIHVHKLGSDKNSSDFVVFVKHQVPLHKHLSHSETVYVLEGSGVLQFGDSKINIGPGHYIKIPAGTPHGVTVTSDIPIKVLSIQAPEFFGKDRVKIETP